MSHFPSLSSGTLMAGKIVYSQFQTGNRTGLEPVLMAAAVPARPGQRIAEIGCGAGAGLLCLAHRIPELNLWGIELDSASLRLAEQNMHANGHTGVTFVNACFPTGLPPEVPFGQFDHCFANPPWHEAESSASPTARRDLARRALPDTLESWIKGASRLLRHKGSLTLALPADQLAAACTALTLARFGDVALCPLWPKRGRAARLMLVQARYGVKNPSRILPGLTLHEDAGGFTPESRLILKDGNPLVLHRQQKTQPNVQKLVHLENQP